MCLRSSLLCDQGGHGNPDAGGGIWKGCIDSSGCYELRGGGTYWYYNVGARTNMRESLGKDPNDYEIADRNWPAGDPQRVVWQSVGTLLLQHELCGWAPVLT